MLLGSYTGIKASVTLRGELSETFEVENRVKQSPVFDLKKKFFFCLIPPEEYG